MKNILLFLILLSSFTFFTCTQEKGKDDTIKVITSILPYGDFIKQVGDSLVDVTVIIPSGASPEVYDPTQKLFKDIQESDMYFAVGNSFVFERNWLKKIQEMNPDLPVIDCSACIEILDHNPHVWLSPDYARIIVTTIAHSLSEKYPEHQAVFLKNAQQFRSKLDTLVRVHRSQFEPYQNAYFITFHPAWLYLAKDYGIREKSIEQHGKEPNPHDLEEIITFAKEHELSTIFVQPQFDTTAAYAIADELEASLVTINPLPENYLENLEDVATKLLEAIAKK